ncbi:anti-anti-sigma factor [Streptomyces fodineus]|uniref:Anti-anti-sigma factor n=1 Tax=Streptomyces fodineus TaxID=1904616 RepID=A0A1D7Y4M5_9ACTN|nr:STAS domain-containing protein [Streptomyces fodineus]AOR30551.1 anti-anti-sigma factor [Streptomyces fodineus]
MSPLKITIRDAATGPVLEIFGELYYGSATGLLEVIPTITLRPGQHFILDLGGMAFCDSSGLSALIAAHAAHAAQADLALAAVPTHTLRTRRIVGLDQTFPIHWDRETIPRS